MIEKKFSARAAGINGFSAFSKSRIFALRQDMSLDVDLVRDFLRHHDGSHILAFGFTFIIWKHVFQSLINSGEKLNLDSCLLLHGGGWKNLAQDEVTPEFFKNSLFDACGIRPENVREYYGMVEQTGSIHMECPHGRLHSSVYGDIFVRRPDNFDLAELGQTGVIQVLTSAASSYPGQSLLTEDEGVILGEDDCPCGRLGKTFKVIGRLKQAETRGCSDTYAESILRN